MLILILIDIQYLQNVVLSFEKGLNGQNHSSSGSHHHINLIPQTKLLIPPLGEKFPPPINAIWKTLH